MALKELWEVMPNFEHRVSELLGEISYELTEISDRSFGIIVKSLWERSVEIKRRQIDIERGIITAGDINLDDMWNELNMMKEYCWDQLNIGHWKQVAAVWRRIYSLLSLLKVIVILGREDDGGIRSAIKECDLGLLLGEPVLDNILSRIAFKLHVIAGPRNDNDGEERQVGVGCEVEFNEVEYRERVRKMLPCHYEGRFDVDVSSRPAIEVFVEDYYLDEKPVVLLDVLRHWPAMSKWSVDYIKKIAGERTVPIEIGSKYTADEWTQKFVTMETFIQEYIESNAVGVKKGYLAQHQLFRQIPELMDDIEIPEYCYVGSSHHVEINAWFGPGGTISPTHYDAKHNILTQIFGSKIIRLFHSKDWQLLYPYGGAILFNTSQIDVEDPELPKKFPAAISAKYTDVLLEPGMALYIPPKWAHYVKSLRPSFSISFWFE